MTYKETWRDDFRTQPKIHYKRKFAIFPKTCSDGTSVWMKYYYKKYKIYGTKTEYHIDFVEDITEEEFIVRKLGDKF